MILGVVALLYSSYVNFRIRNIKEDFDVQRKVFNERIEAIKVSNQDGISRIMKLETDMPALSEKYVLKTDLKDLRYEIMECLRRIENKLNSKVDKKC